MTLVPWTNKVGSDIKFILTGRGPRMDPWGTEKIFKWNSEATRVAMNYQRIMFFFCGNLN